MNAYDVIIVGAGPAGLTAAIYARRASKTVLVLEAKAWGGQIINTPDIENYPVVAHISGADFANELYRQATALGAELKLEKVTGVEDFGKTKKIRTTMGEYEAGAVILATGSENRKLGVDREQELTGRGVSYCATCDGNFFRGRDVAVVGGGNTALEDALYLSQLCTKVYIVHRRDQFRGTAALQKSVLATPNIEVVWSHVPVEILGEQKGFIKKVTGLKVKHAQTGEERTLEVDGVFEAIGVVPTTELFVGQLDMNEQGYLITKPDSTKTNVEGVFAAGDVQDPVFRQAVIAAGTGSMAGIEASRFLLEQ